jgi:hypothetical protein
VSFVNAKVFALNPDEYLGVRMGFQGRVVSQGPGSAWLELEDETGRLLVGTERLGMRIECGKNSQIKLVGTLTKLKQGNMLYLSVDDLLSCKV